MGLNPNAIITVAMAREYIKILTADDDTRLERIINGVSNYFEKHCGINFINASQTDIFEGNGTNKINLVKYPVISLTSVTIRDYTTQLLADYYVDYQAGILYSRYGIFPVDFQNVTIVYTTGYGATYVDLPADIQLAGMIQTHFHYKRDEADFSDTFEEGMVIRAPSELLIPQVKTILEPYKKQKVY